MRRVDFLIQSVREISRTTANEDNSVPVTDGTIIQYLNDGKNRIATLLVGLKNVQRPFLAEQEISIVAGTSEYAIPDRLAMNKHIQQVMLSYSGQEADYVRMDKLNIYNREYDSVNYPIGYFVANGRINLTPVPNLTGATIRVMYDRALDDLDKRRGKISTVTGLTATTFTSITLDSSADETSTPNLSSIDYVCINDPDGTVTAYNIPVGSYDTGTNVLTPRSGFTFTYSGQTIAVDSYVTFNKYSTTHCKLPDECERYLIHYAAQCVMHQESSTDVVTENSFLAGMEEDIIKGFGTQTGELQNFPTLNYQDW